MVSNFSNVVFVPHNCVRELNLSFFRMADDGVIIDKCQRLWYIQRQKSPCHTPDIFPRSCDMFDLGEKKADVKAVVRNIISRDCDKEFQEINITNVLRLS